MLRTVSFFVPGIPQQKGSTKSFLNPKTRRIVTKSDNKNLKAWEAVVRLKAAEAWRGGPSAGPITVRASFYFPRPKSHLKPSGGLTKSAPREHIRQPDIDKLGRGLLDAFTGVVCKDDSYVVRLYLRKHYSDSRVGASIHIEEV